MEKNLAPDLAEIRIDCPIDSVTVASVRRLVQPGSVTYCQVNEMYMVAPGAWSRRRTYYILVISNWHTLSDCVQTLVLLTLTGAQVIAAPRKYNPGLLWDELIALE